MARIKIKDLRKEKLPSLDETVRDHVRNARFSPNYRKWKMVEGLSLSPIADANKELACCAKRGRVI